MHLHLKTKDTDSPQPVPKHHVFIGLGSLASLAITVVFLTVAGKSHSVAAAETTVFEINIPKVIERTTTPTVVAPVAIEAEESEPAVDITNNDGLEVSSPESGNYGIGKTSSVQMTKELAKFSQYLSKYFADNKLHAVITSAVRTSERQLDLIKERIERYGVNSEFPELTSAGVSDTAKWIKAFEWLKQHRIPVDPPATYTRGDGNSVRGSLHLQGLALDLSGGNLDILAQHLANFWAWTETHPLDGLKVAGLLRERDCVHISLSAE